MWQNTESMPWRRWSRQRRKSETPLTPAPYHPYSFYQNNFLKPIFIMSKELAFFILQQIALLKLCCFAFHERSCQSHFLYSIVWPCIETFILSCNSAWFFSQNASDTTPKRGRILLNLFTPDLFTCLVYNLSIKARNLCLSVCLFVCVPQKYLQIRIRLTWKLQHGCCLVQGCAMSHLFGLQWNR